MVIVEVEGKTVRLGSVRDQIYSLEDEQGWQYHWNVTEGLRLAQSRGGLLLFSPAEHDITLEVIRSAYIGLNELYALTTDLSRPLLFVRLNGQSQLADGWHRLFRAVVTGASCLPAYVLTEAESEAILVFRFPPGQGLDWGQEQSVAATSDLEERRAS